MGVRTVSAILMMAALAACAAAPASLTGFTSAALGRKIDETISANGPPTAQWDLPDGRRVYQWQQASIVARVGSPAGDGAVVGAASQTTCTYTLYAAMDGKTWKVVGYEPPRAGCGRLAMNP
jgi:hypothetical protein